MMYNPEPILVDTRTACQMLSIRRTSLFGFLRRGTLERRKAGSKTLVTVASIQAFAEGTQSKRKVL